MAIQVSCPHCGRQHAWQDNPWRPFCSERCKLIDLGAWLEERHVVPGDEIDPATDPESPRH